MTTPAPGTIEARLDLRSNSLNAIRLVLATAVIVSHAWPIGGFGDDPAIGDVNLGHLAVGGFFAISGYLIAQSRLVNRPGRYAAKRAMRILPAFWVCLIVTGFGLSSVAATRTGGWTPADGWRYVLSWADLWNGDWGIGSTLDRAPFATAWNGSLWTLPSEVACYVILGLGLAIAPVRRSPWWSLLAFVGATVAAMNVPHGTPGPIQDLAFLAPAFAAGTMLLFWSSRVRVDGRLALLAAIAFVGVALAGVGQPLGALPLAYLCLYAGITLPPALRRIGSVNDVSYGMYLYGFPVAQLLVVLDVHRAGVVVFVLACVAATVPFAAASWWLVERPAMRLLRRRTRQPVAGTRS
jgi:peptidoglycan/LPS O-acetylase OafA/YrhL